MSSINTNIAAMTALQSLNQTNKSMLVTQNRISTGLRVGNASDNAAYWSIATTMRSDRSAVSTVSDALGLGSATVDVAMQGMEGAIKIAGQIKDKLLAARAPGLDRGKIQSEITQLQESLRSAVSTSNFSGQNWLAADGADSTRSLVSSFSRDASGNISVGTISVDLSKTRLLDTGSGTTGILDSMITAASGGADFRIVPEDDGSGTPDPDAINISTLTDDSQANLDRIEDFIKGVDSAIAKMTDGATVLGAVKSRIDMQKDFADNLMDAIDTGIGQLVDADMNEESTRLQALQVRQQLGVQALGMANQSAQSILSLFR
ncbi:MULTISPECIES: flagellin [Hyphomicrobium]|jgi:flagellin|uniref:flagellin N-terminal helical domain-containing protein n=1 Tax=Hyphomicrobium TaxID=81 RepID=UPI0003698B8C|nr:MULTISPECIES: flagellin [Hyphomicrobium]WBT39265.1 flagellin [Hyphomicrobium sp. DMF-1]HML43424.1 flagellin [Hyphomicrobium zavarzinii]